MALVETESLRCDAPVKMSNGHISELFIIFIDMIEPEICHFKDVTK